MWVRCRIHRTPIGLVMMEALIALAIAAIGLVCLLRLHIANMAWPLRLQSATEATSIALDRIWYARIAGLPTPLSGTVTINGRTYCWQIRLDDLDLPGLKRAGRLRSITVTVSPAGRPALVSLQSVICSTDRI
ncbi:MAG: hypothetical protein QHH07_12280 [Sedimentisphaerales bacterium]|jgi:hypothetical protein|nr:hypothetical protein [Sedimentisphaerales bacterium]